MCANSSDLASERSQTGVDLDEEPVLEAQNLTKYFDQTEGFIDRLIGSGDQVQAVDGVNLSIRRGETVAIVGESGCGKSTLAETVLNLYEPTDGTIQFKGEDITGLSKRQMRPYRRDIQMIFQDPLASLNPRQKVGDIVRAPMEVHDIGENESERTERAEALLERVGLKPGHMDRFPTQFSGGQQQRISIARALTLEPDLLIADEPVSALDVSVQAQVLNLLDELQEEFDLSLLVIAHDLSVVRLIADRVIVMYLGEFVETAPTEELFERPRHPYTKSLLSAVPRINPNARTERVVLRGTVPSPIDPPDGCRFHTRCPVVIPPEDWPGDQSTFRAAFTYRTRLLENELDPEAVRKRMGRSGAQPSDEQVVDRLLEISLPTEKDELPPAVRDTVEEATRLLVAGDHENARSVMREGFESPCEQSPRKDTEVGQEHEVACHRFDESAPGEPIWES